MPTRSASISQNTEDTQNSSIEIHELLGNPPGWLMYSGISIVFVFVLLMGLLSWFIKYPDKIEAPVFIESKNPPIEIISTGLHIIDSLMITEGQEVEVGQILAILENPTIYEDFQALANWVHLFRLHHKKHFLSIPELSSNLQLGDLQFGYAQLLQLLDDFKYYSQQEDAPLQIAALEREIMQIRELNQSFEAKKLLFEQELKLEAKELERTNALQKMGAASEEDLEMKEAEWLQMQRQQKDLQSSHIQNQIRIEQIKSRQLQLNQEQKHSVNSRLIMIRQQVKQLDAEIQQWKKNYLIIAPISGKISLSASIVAKQFVRGQEILFTILPTDEKGGLIARCQVPLQGIGKLSVGTPVLIYLDAYPFREFGILETAVSGMAQVPQKDKNDQFLYHLTALLPDTLTTSYHKVIPFRQKLTGQAVLISEDKRILERVFQQLISLVHNQT